MMWSRMGAVGVRCRTVGDEGGTRGGRRGADRGTGRRRWSWAARREAKAPLLCPSYHGPVFFCAARLSISSLKASVKGVCTPLPESLDVSIAARNDRIGP
jgi:hypothetical protein